MGRKLDLVEERLTGEIIGAAIEVHKHLGPGLLESAYQECLSKELELRHLGHEREKVLAVEYKGLSLNCGYRMDFLIEQIIVVELKAVEKIEPVHEAQLLTYLRLAHCKVGLLINFNVPLLKEGIVRMVL